jgi:DNA-binding CsgD family transcriptional regulator
MNSFPLESEAAEALATALAALGKPNSGIPYRKLVDAAVGLGGTDLSIDFSAAQQIGVPVIVLREARMRSRPSMFDQLSRREQMVARHIVRGRTNAEIAHRLGISVCTVKDHVHHILQKTGLNSRTELAAAFAREEL